MDHSSVIWRMREYYWLNLRFLVKVARSGFWMTIPFNFEQLVYHSEQPNRKSIIPADLEKDESFKWDKFHWNRSYHSNVMPSSPILHENQLHVIHRQFWETLDWNFDLTYLYSRPQNFMNFYESDFEKFSGEVFRC